MALGQSSNPLESADGTAATVAPKGNDGTAVLVLDQESRDTLLRIEKHLETISTLLQLMNGGGVTGG